MITAVAAEGDRITSASNVVSDAKKSSSISSRLSSTIVTVTVCDDWLGVKVSPWVVAE